MRTLKRILVDAEKCAGCRCCEMVCSFHHEGAFSPSHSRVTVMKEDRYGLDYPVMCHQCKQCPSVEACPAETLTKKASGTVHIDEEVCTGCGACVEACTFEAVKLDGSKAIVCDLCGGSPVCVARCPTGALEYVETGEVPVHPNAVFKALMRRWNIVA
jgi:Fe-S-cluster-containing hydrogenase component 2